MKPPFCRCEDPKGTQFSIPIEQCDKFIAQPPADAQKVKQYVIDLEKKVAECEGGH